MPRGQTSRADLDLLDRLARRGIDWVSPYQLERWRLLGLLPTAARHGLGRGAGTWSEYPPEAEPLAAIWACKTFQGVALHPAVLDLFMEGVPMDAKAVRWALGKIYEDVRRQIARVRAQGDAAVDKKVQEAGRQVRLYDQALLSFGVDPDLPRSARDSRAKRRKDLKEAAELMTQVAYEDEQPGASLVVDYLRLRGYTNIADTVAPGLFAAEAENALNPPDASALGTIARIIETLDDTKLRAARNVIAIWAGINLFLALGLIGESLSLPLYQVMEADDGIRFIRDAVGLFPSQGQIAGVLVSLAMADWWLEAAWEYGVAVFGIVARTATAAFALAKADPEAVRFMKLVADVDLAAAPGPYTDLPVSLELLEAKAETAFASLEWDDPAS